MTSVFRARGVSVSFGGVRAVAGVDLEIEPGELVGLIGPNGAGKTTFIDAVTGFVRSEGSVELGGHLARRAAAARPGAAWPGADLADRRAVRRPDRPGEPDGRRRGPGASVDEELKVLRPGARGRVNAMGAHPGRAQAGGHRAGPGSAAEAALPRRARGRPGHAAEQGVRRAAARHRATGTAVLLVDHDMGLVLSVCDRVAVLDAGAIIAQGTPAQVRGDQRVIAAYLGHASAGTAGA